MRIFNKLVFSKKEPSNENDIWFDGKQLKWFNNGSWEVMAVKEASSTVDWDLKEGEPGAIKNRPFGFNNIIHLWDADEVSLELINTEFEEYRATFKFKGGKFEEGLDHMFAKQIELGWDGISKDISYKEIKSGEYFRISEISENFKLNIVFDDYTDDDYETIISLEGPYIPLYKERLNECIILTDDIINLRTTLPELFIPSSIARTSELQALAKRVEALEDAVK